MPPAALRTPGNAAPTGATAAPPGANNWCTAWSASNNGTPILRSIAAAVLLPIPIEPVSPTTITAAVPGLRQSRSEGRG